jgi:hypothetical protein
MLNWLSDGKRTAAERREETLSAYIDGELSSRERANLERALTRDATLRAELEELRQVVGLMKAVPRAPLPRSFTLDPAVYGRARQAWLQLYPVLRTATVLATVVLVFLFAGDLYLNLSGRASMPAQTFQEPQVAEMREAVEIASEKVEVEVTLLAEAPAAKIAAGEVQEEAADLVPEEAGAPAAAIEAQAESAAQVMGTESMTEAPAAATAAAPRGEATLVEELEEPAEPPMIMAIPPTMTTEAEPEGEGGLPEPAMPEATAAAVALEATVTADVMTAREPAEEELVLAADDEETPVNWVLVTEIGLAALAGGLLVLTLLARRYGW